MGVTASLQAESNVLTDSANELKVFRQIRAEYFRLSEKDLDDAELMKGLRKAYQSMVDRIDPLKQCHGDKPVESWTCPKVRYGRTELMMPIITCGGMRQQFTWKQQEKSRNDDISKDCSENFQAIVDRSMALGINHFETAKGYGTSEIQFGHALKKHDRSSFILQTKIVPTEDPAAFRKTLDMSFEKLQVDYLDIFSFHGINNMKQLEWTLREGGCMEVIDEYRRNGKIKWVGFSTHGPASVIRKVIETNKFDSINIHYQFVGSYTASGTSKLEEGDGGNTENVELAHSLDMGVFCISPNDKGGMLYKPSKVLADSCMESSVTPIEYHYLWLWTKEPTVHTFSVGVARPSDFDECVAAVNLLDKAGEIVPTVEERLRGIAVERLGEDWMSSWWKGLPGVYETPTGVFVTQIVWLWTLIKAWGMYDFARARYQALEQNLKGRKPELSDQQNLDAMNSFVPGYAYRPDVDMNKHIPDSYPMKAKVLEILEEAHEWLTGQNESRVRQSLEQRGWQAAYDLQADIPFPERK